LHQASACAYSPAAARVSSVWCGEGNKSACYRNRSPLRVHFSFAQYSVPSSFFSGFSFCSPYRAPQAQAYEINGCVVSVLSPNLSLQFHSADFSRVVQLSQLFGFARTKQPTVASLLCMTSERELNSREMWCERLAVLVSRPSFSFPLTHSSYELP
jgi:hypothetical protein